VVDAEQRYHVANQTYSLNFKELVDFDNSLDPQPAGYKVNGGGRLALAFGFEIQATPEASGPHFYVNQSGVVRYSNWGEAEENSDPVK
jgi:hypothetical protein